MAPQDIRLQNQVLGYPRHRHDTASVSQGIRNIWQRCSVKTYNYVSLLEISDSKAFIGSDCHLTMEAS